MPGPALAGYWLITPHPGMVEVMRLGYTETDRLCSCEFPELELDLTEL